MAKTNDETQRFGGGGGGKVTDPTKINMSITTNHTLLLNSTTRNNAERRSLVNPTSKFPKVLLLEEA